MNAQASGFSAEERAAMKQRAAELKAEAKRSTSSAKATAKAAADVQQKIAQMPESDRALAERVHDIVTTAAPGLAAKLYYKQPGYAKDGKIVCFFRSGLMDKERYSTFGFSVHAKLDDEDGLWQTSFAIADPTDAAWERLAGLIAKAARDDADVGG